MSIFCLIRFFSFSFIGRFIDALLHTMCVTQQIASTNSYARLYLITKLFYSVLLFLRFGSVLVAYLHTHLQRAESFYVFCLEKTFLAIFFPVLYSLCAWNKWNEMIERVCVCSADFIVSLRCQCSYLSSMRYEQMYFFRVFEFSKLAARRLANIFSCWPYQMCRVKIIKMWKKREFRRFLMKIAPS